MWLLRICNHRLWQDASAEVDEDVNRASEDINLRPGERGVSVFSVGDHSEANRVAVEFAVVARDYPGPVAYVLFDSDAVAKLDLTLAKTPSTLAPSLSDRHHEIIGLTHGSARLLAGEILAGSPRPCTYMTKGEVRELAVKLDIDHGDVGDHIKPKWRESIEKKRAHLSRPEGHG